MADRDVCFIFIGLNLSDGDTANTTATAQLGSEALRPRLVRDCRELSAAVKVDRPGGPIMTILAPRISTIVFSGLAAIFARIVRGPGDARV